MKKTIGILVTLLAAVILSVNVLAAETATPTASATVLTACGITATNIAFGNLLPGQTYTSDDVYSTISMPTGNQPETPTIEGTEWSDEGTNTMVVGQTHWHLTATTLYGSMNVLTNSPVSIGQEVSYENPVDVYFKLAIPAGQDAASYSQTMTLTVTC